MWDAETSVHVGMCPEPSLQQAIFFRKMDISSVVLTNVQG
jgi:hypothetical protein